MTPFEIAASPDEITALCAAALDPTEALLAALPTASHGVVAMFVAFIGACQLAGVSPWFTFEALLAGFEERSAANHRGSNRIN